jgi:hypothetical protein
MDLCWKTSTVCGNRIGEDCVRPNVMEEARKPCSTIFKQVIIHGHSFGLKKEAPPRPPTGNKTTYSNRPTFYNIPYIA